MKGSVRILYGYTEIKGHSLGLVFMIDKLDKTKGMLVMQGVYIDLRDHSVLKTIKAVGAPDGFGYSMYWANAVDNAYKFFVTANGNYLQRLRHHFKKKK